MTDFITVEPARELAPALAAYLLQRDPGIQTVSAGGFLIPLALYPDVPAELLYGAYVDGFAYSGSAPQPVPAEPYKAPSVTEMGVTKSGAPRKRRAPAKASAVSAPKDDVIAGPDVEVSE